jgi:S1-C subfamily serine protease
MENNFKKSLVIILVTSVVVSSVFGGIIGFSSGLIAANGGMSKMPKWIQNKFGAQTKTSGGSTISTVNEESAVISVVDKISPAVVSIIITKDLPKVKQNYGPFGSNFFQQFFGDNNPFGQSAPQAPQDNSQGGGTQKQEIGGGTGFIVSADGYIVTNKHVAADEAADYTVLMNNEKKYPAKVLARDTVNDLAILKIDATDLPTVEFGDSGNLKVGQSVIAIGNALGEFRNTVSVGVISGLLRSITAGGEGFSENLTGVIQTDASINPGNSGGPLLNIAGQVIGIDTAVAQNAQGIGFAIPINELKKTIDSVKKNGKIVRPWLGVRYVMVDKALADANKLTVDYGALILRGTNRTDLAIVPGSPADKAGLEENDIILELNGKKIDSNNILANALNLLNPGDEIKLKVLHKGKKIEVKVKLEEMK